MDNKELIERLRSNIGWLERDGFLTTARNVKEAAEALAKADELIQQQAAALAEKDEALLKGARMAEALKKECGMNPESPQAIRNGEYMNVSYVLRAAIAIQPCPEVLRKVKADAVREAAKLCEKVGNNDNCYRCAADLLNYADRIQRGEGE